MRFDCGVYRLVQRGGCPVRLFDKPLADETCGFAHGFGLVEMRSKDLCDRVDEFMGFGVVHS